VGVEGLDYGIFALMVCALARMAILTTNVYAENLTAAFAKLLLSAGI
jgi:hypothetical protein